MKLLRTLRRALAIVASTMIVLSVVAFSHDAYDNHQSHPVTPTYSLHTAGHSDALIVYLPGILATGTDSSEPFRSTVLKYGDLMAVNYDKGAPSTWLHFYPKAVVRSTADGIVTRLQSGHYRRLVFIGSSMGGLLAWDIQQELGNKLKGVRVDMIALDAPTERGDFQSPNDTLSLAMYLSWGPWLNKLDLVPKLIIKSPDEHNIEEGVDQQKLQASVEIAQSFQMSFNRDQVKYILTHGGPTDGSLDVRRFVYVRSTRDDNTVRPEAVEGWRHTPVRSDAFSEFFVDSTHVGFSERPETWKTAFVELFEQELDFEPAV